MAFYPIPLAKLNFFGPKGLYLGSFEALNEKQYKALISVVGDSEDKAFSKTVDEVHLNKIKEKLISATHSIMYLKTPYPGMTIEDVNEHKQYLIDCLEYTLGLVKEI